VDKYCSPAREQQRGGQGDAGGDLIYTAATWGPVRARAVGGSIARGHLPPLPLKTSPHRHLDAAPWVVQRMLQSKGDLEIRLSPKSGEVRGLEMVAYMVAQGSERPVHVLGTVLSLWP